MRKAWLLVSYMRKNLPKQILFLITKWACINCFRLKSFIFPSENCS
jgi:hypothetical protein